MKLSPRDQLIAIVVVGVLLVGALFALLVLPMFGKLKNLDSQIEAATGQVSLARAQLAKRQEIKNNAAVTGATLLQLANEVPENPELPSLIIDLQDAAYDAEVRIKSIKPGELKSNAGYAAVPVDIDFVGGWLETIDYLQAVRKLTRQIRIVSFDAKRYSNPESTDIDMELYSVRTVLKIEAYVVPASATASSAPAPVTPAPAPAQ